MVKAAVLFICEQLLGELIHLNFIILLLIWFSLMITGVNYVIYGCSSARKIPGVSLYQSLKENIIAVITQDKVIDGSLKRQIKNRALCAWRLFLLI